VSAVGLAAGPDGLLMVTFSAPGSAGASALHTATSADGGLSWSPAREASVSGPAGAWTTTAPAVSLGPQRWAVPATRESPGEPPQVVILRTEDGGATFAPTAPVAAGCVEPALAVARDGRWLVLARRQQNDEIVQCLSTDAGATWTAPTDTGLRGHCPAAVELLQTFFVAAALGDDGNLTGGLAWDEAKHWLPSRIACGHLVRINGRKLVAMGCGVDLAGEFNRLAQVPLDAPEIAAAEAQPHRTLAATDQASRFEGKWERVQDGQGVRFVSKGLDTVRVRFRGTAVFLVHGRQPDGRILQVTIDGEEHPPAETQGADDYPVRTCLAAGLPPGEHELVLRPLLSWQTGSMVIGGVEVVGAD
jgi:hypothetical protein